MDIVWQQMSTIVQLKCERQGHCAADFALVRRADADSAIGYRSACRESAPGPQLCRLVDDLGAAGSSTRRLFVALTIVFATRLGERPAFGSIGVPIILLSVLSIVLAMIVGADAYGGWMRALSIAIVTAYVLLTALRLAIAALVGQPHELIGMQERTMSYAYLFWVLALAVYPLLSMRSAAAIGATRP